MFDEPSIKKLPEGRKRADDKMFKKVIRAMDNIIADKNNGSLSDESSFSSDEKELEETFQLANDIVETDKPGENNDVISSPTFVSANDMSSTSCSKDVSPSSEMRVTPSEIVSESPHETTDVPMDTHNTDIVERDAPEINTPGVSINNSADGNMVVDNQNVNPLANNAGTAIDTPMFNIQFNSEFLNQRNLPSHEISDIIEYMQGMFGQMNNVLSTRYGNNAIEKPSEQQPQNNNN